MSMSKKDYERVADTLGETFAKASLTRADASVLIALKRCQEDLSDAFAADNERFQPDTFKDRIGEAVRSHMAAASRKADLR